MKEFDVTITETLKLTVSVEASSKEEAQQMVSDQWHAGDHILDADNFVEVEFESNDGKEISAERAQNDTLEVLMVEPGQYPRVERIGSDLASLQKAVDGYIEAIYPYDGADLRGGSQAGGQAPEPRPAGRGRRYLRYCGR